MIQIKDELRFGHSVQSQIAGPNRWGFYEDKLGNGLLDNYIIHLLPLKQ